MRVLYIGGTGNISSACVAESLARGHEVTLLTRGNLLAPVGVHAVLGDRQDRSLLADLASQSFDVVANFLGFVSDDIDRDVGAFRGHVGQYLFVSSAACYEKPPQHHVITEDTPLANPYWQYARDKIACEAALRQAMNGGFPATIVRPSYTYGETWVPCSVGGHGYTVVDRIRRAKPIISHGDGQSLWVLTHTSDFAVGFVGLFGKAKALGEAFQITSDEVQTWDGIYRTIAQAAGREARIEHISSAFIAGCYPKLGPGLLGDKTYSVVFDCRKLKRVVPEFEAKVTFAEGIRRSLAWHDADPNRRHTVNAEVDAMMDDLIARHRAAMGSGDTG